MLGKKSTLSMAIFGAIYSLPALSSTYDDDCTSYAYSDGNITYSCILSDITDNELDLANVNLDGLIEFDLENGEEDTPYIIKNLSISDDHISDGYEYTGDDDSNDAYTLAPLINLYGNDGATFELDSWNINISKQIHELINIDRNMIAGIKPIIMNNSSISANADTIFSAVDIWSDNPQNGNNYQLLTVNDSSIINTKQHVNFIATEDDYYPTINTSLGSIIQLDNLYQFDDEQAITINVDFNNSYLEAEAFVGLGLETSGDKDKPRPSAYNLTLTNSTGKFDNLLSRLGAFETEGYLQIDNVVVNLDNSTVSAGIYSEINGGYRNERATLNLANNSVFNYLGGCTENCNEYLIMENETESTLSEMATYSYIHAINISNNSTLAFSSEGDFKTLYVDKMTSDGTANLVMNSELSALQSDFLYLGEAEGRFNVMVNDHGGEPAEDSLLALISVEQGNGQFTLNEGKGVDIGAYVYDLKKLNYADGKSVWFLNPQGKDVECDVCEETDDNEDNEDNKDNGDSEDVIKQPQTSPSTDAVISMASATHFILSDELQNVRMLRGDVESNNHGTGNVWGRILGGRLDVNGAADSSYKLNRSGMEFGSDKLFQLGDDKLMIGVTASLSDNKVKHTRGGTSDIDSYGVGLYATYLTDSKVYVDGVVKYMYFNNSLNAVTTNGDAVSSEYKQYGLGAALEFGYKYQQDQLFVEPYGRMSYSNVSGKSITLSNGMKAKLDDYKSLLGEVGVSVGMQFVPSDTVAVKPYVKVAVEHEFIKNNDVVINKAHQFKNDFSGSAGKYGVGVNVDLGKNTSLFGEVNYSKGRHIESPVRANIGVRINF